MRKGCINGKGFTLIELLVVVLIIGILATIALPQYQKAVRRARLTEAKVILKNLTDAQDMYFLRESGGDSLNSVSEWNAVLDEQFPESTANWEFYTDECGFTSGGGCVNVAAPVHESGYEIAYYSQEYCRAGYGCGFECWEYDGKSCSDFGGVELRAGSSRYTLP